MEGAGSLPLASLSLHAFAPQGPATARLPKANKGEQCKDKIDQSKGMGKLTVCQAPYTIYSEQALSQRAGRPLPLSPLSRDSRSKCSARGAS